MPVHVPLSYKGLDSMPPWFVVLVAVLATIGIVLAYRRRR
ncbi:MULTISPECIES: LPXTG cell wall anchor domain-containing protein [unclassified Streptomyces]|nr:MULTISPECIES: LPXTG cell wall anchor domain-containing protein [unclassified Streptomyces]